jgi:hypothetical protein
VNEKNHEKKVLRKLSKNIHPLEGSTLSIRREQNPETLSKYSLHVWKLSS